MPDYQIYMTKTESKIKSLPVCCIYKALVLSNHNPIEISCRMKKYKEILYSKLTYETHLRGV